MAEFDGITREFITASTENEFRSLMKDVFQKIGVNGEAFENIFKEAKIEEVNGEWHINDKPFSKVDFHLRSGRIGKFLNEIKLDGSAISEQMEQSFRKTILKNAPEVRLADLEDEVKAFKEKVPEMNTKIDDLKDMNEEVQQKVAETAKKNGWLSIKTVATMNAVGLTAAVIVSIIQEMKNLTGCYVYTTLDGVTDHCKLMNRTIQPHNFRQCPKTSNADLKYNLNLTLRRVKKDAATLKLNDSTLSPLLSILEISNINELTVEIIPAKIRSKRKELSNFFKTYEVTIGDISELLVGDEKNKVCVACNPSAPIDSIDYVDTAGLPTNITLSCETNPTIIDAIAKFTGDGASEVIDNISKALGMRGILSWIARFVLLIIVVVLFGKFVVERYGHKIPFLGKLGKAKPNNEDIEIKPLRNEF